MDIHKPKAAHSWREFLIEIGTIICGILIALALEQAVEVVHRTSEVREAREALRAEIKADAATIRFGLEEDKCLLAQVDAYAAWARGGHKPPALRTILAEYSSSTWDTVKTTAVPHMPLHDRLAAAQFYDTVSNEQKVVDVQRTNAQVLIGADERQTLGPSETGRILDAVGVERRLTYFHISNGEGLLELAAEMGVTPPQLTPEGRRSLSWLCGGRAS